MNHIMLDIETLGTRPGSVILQVAAVKFDPITGAVGDSFCSSVPTSQQHRRGATRDEATNDWWLDDPERSAILQRITCPFGEVTVVLNALANFVVDSNPPRLWASSPNFDMVLLEDLYRRFSVSVPWTYRQFRDLRTLIDLVGAERYSDILPAPEGAHDALVDARYQAQVACRAMRTIERWHNCAATEDCE